jgi:DNA-binding XRE family transcriptional regulator
MGNDDMTELQFLVQHLIEHPPRPVVFDGKAPRLVPKVTTGKLKTTGKRKTPLASFRGEELLRIRKLQRLSQSEAAAIVGVITKTYAAYEANLLPIPNRRFDRMAGMLGGSKSREASNEQ